MQEEFVQVGKLKKTFGSNGDISFRLFNENGLNLKVLDVIFISLDGIYVPFFLSMCSIGNKSVLHLDDVDTIKEAEDLAGKAIFLRKEDVLDSNVTPEELEYGFLKGFLLKDQNNKEIGIIEDIVSYPMQEMAIVKNNVLIPINQRLIIEMNTEKKIFRYEIIDGLLD